MKITRKQLKTIILESILNEMPMIRPKDPMDFINNPDHKRKLDILKDDDEAHAYNIAATIQPDLEDILTPKEQEEMEADLPPGAQLEEPGYRGDDYFQDLRRYKQISLMGTLGNSVYYLADEDVDILTNIIGEDLYFGLYSWAGTGFENIIQGGPGVSPDDIYPMGIRIAAKKRDIDESDFDKHEGMDSGVDAYHKLSIAIIELSNTTLVDRYNLEDLGIGEKIGTGKYEFWRPEYEKLWKEKKLIIRV